VIRWHQRIRGFRFHPDCPDYVKARLFAAALPTGEPPKLAHCYREWVELYDETTPGWWFPFVGFVSDKRLQEIAQRLRAVVKWQR
jgi:hypothetical protein